MSTWPPNKSFGKSKKGNTLRKLPMFIMMAGAFTLLTCLIFLISRPTLWVNSITMTLIGAGMLITGWFTYKLPENWEQIKNENNSKIIVPTKKLVLISLALFLLGAASNRLLFGIYIYYGTLGLLYAAYLILNLRLSSFKAILPKLSFIFGALCGWIFMCYTVMQ